MEKRLSRSVVVAWLPPDDQLSTVSQYHVAVAGVVKAVVPSSFKLKALLEDLSLDRYVNISVRAVYDSGPSADAACTLAVGLGLCYARTQRKLPPPLTIRFAFCRSACCASTRSCHKYNADFGLLKLVSVEFERGAHNFIERSQSWRLSADRLSSEFFLFWPAEMKTISSFAHFFGVQILAFPRFTSIFRFN